MDVFEVDGGGDRDAVAAAERYLSFCASSVAGASGDFLDVLGVVGFGTPGSGAVVFEVLTGDFEFAF